MEIEFGTSNATDKKPTGRGLGIAGVAIAIALALVDFVVLRGEHVDDTTIRLSADDPARIVIDRVGEEHLVEISTQRALSGKTEARSVSYRLEDPDGQIVVEESELVTRKRRFVRFAPDVPGEYQLFVEDPALLGGSNGSARVSVYVNDRRLLGRFLPF